MPSTPNRLQPDSSLADNLALANDNFDKAVQDVGDLGAKFSGNFFILFTIAAGSWSTTTVNISDSRAQYRRDSLPFQPRIDLWVDTDNTDASNYFNSGNTLTSAQRNLMVNIVPIKTVIQVLPTDVASYAFQIRNFDTSSHNYYVRGDDWYLQSPITGNFR